MVRVFQGAFLLAVLMLTIRVMVGIIRFMGRVFYWLIPFDMDS